jgi:hypothetical protein
MRAPRLPLGIVLIGLVACAACAGPPSPPSPPPAEPYTDFSPVELKVEGQPDWMAAGFGSVWVKGERGMVSRIDPATATITAEIEADTTSPDHCNGIGVGTAGVWSCSFHDLVRLDPGTNRVAATIPTEKIHGQGRLVHAAGRIWILAGEGDQLVGVAEDDGSLSEPIALPVSCNDLGAVADIVFVACESADRVLRVDPAGAKVTADVPIPGPAHLSAASSGVWVAAEDRTLRLDPTSLATTLTVDGVVAGFDGGIKADDTGVWVRRADPFLTRIDAATGAQTRVISAPFDNGGDVLVDGAYVWVSDPANVVVRLDIPAAPKPPA